MSSLPTGTITFLLSDIEGSVHLWEQHAAAMRMAVARHDELIERLVREHGGTLVRPRGEGDSRFAVFTSAIDAVLTARAVQLALARERWPLPRPLRVRMALHTGEADRLNGDYYGTAVNRCARLRDLAHGGQIVLSGLTASLVRDRQRGDEVVLLDLGVHALRGLTQPEHVFQVQDSRLPADFPPLRSIGPARTNLPEPSTSFVGREAAVSELRRLASACSLLTLTATAGAGKTRLAVHVARGLAESFEGGAWLVELAAVAGRDGTVLPRTVAQALRVPEQPGRPVLDSVIDRLRGAPALLVLDNCEHLIRPSAILAMTLLRACPGLRILATSREPLRVAGELVWQVPPLGVPGGEVSLSAADAIEGEAVRLFVDRARAQNASFELTDANVADVVEVCRRLDGLPLAIELAAAWARLLSPRQIADRLDDRFRLLTRGERDAPSRQHTLRAAIDWSYELLSVEAQQLFAELSVFAGGFDLEAVEAVCSSAGASVVDLLGELIDKSLVTVEPAADLSAMRYRLLDTLRAYARDRLRSSRGLDDAQRRHAEHFAVRALLAESKLRGPEQGAWFDRLELDHDNLLSALAWAAQSGAVELGVAMCGAILRFWLIRHPGEGAEWVAVLLASASDLDASARARGLDIAGHLAMVRGDLEQAVALHVACVGLRRETADAAGLSRALYALGSVQAELGKYAAARGCLEECLELRERSADQRGVAAAMSTLAEVARRQGELDRAVQLGHQALALARAAGDDSVVATTLNNLGYTEFARGQSADALTYLAEATALFARLGDALDLAECCHRLAELSTKRGYARLAARLIGACDALRERAGSPRLPFARAEYDRAVSQVRSALDAGTFAVARADAYADDPEQVLQQVLEMLGTDLSRRLEALA